MADSRRVRPRVIAPAERVLADVQEGLLRDGARPGAHVPSERDLTGSLGVSRRSAREALAALEAVGVVRGGPAHRELAEAPAAGIGRLLRLLLVAESVPGPALLTLRTELERTAAEGAARRVDRRDRAELSALLVAMREPGIPADRFARLDTALHLRIARASHNQLHEQLMRGLRDAVAARMAVAFRAVEDWPATARRLAGEHDRLVGAITAGDPAGAAELAESHLRGFY
ncbi:FCD domain-containing protein [Pseudonocardia eucalypti]|uniref:FCD domain-containing protein n=1 Tax=Pseudonocardia eucalypti TaxID=648755 RepID=A0ABP9QMS0_9PSEU|nr:DNA-binding FadR family transcriptional regulator [Pseudonocardia eucalypti]